MTVPTPTELEGLLERANARRAHRQSIKDWNDGRIRARFEIVDLLPAVIARIKELSEALERIASGHVEGPYGIGCHEICDACHRQAIARAALTLNRSKNDG